MTDWAARATAHFQKKGRPPTDRNDETPIPSVSSVAVEGVYAESQDGFAGSVSTRDGAIPECAIPADVEARLVRMVSDKAIDADDAELVRRRFHAYPAEWLFLLDCCERAAQERTR